MNTFYLEMTDTYSGQLNYSSLTRFKVQANTILGALQKVSAYTGLNFRQAWRVSSMFEFDGWVSRSGCTGLYEPEYYQDDEELSKIYDFTEI